MAQTTHPGPLRVLVVDDEPAVRRMLVRVLERDGHSVDEAADGAEAMRRVEAGPAPYDVILADLRMPGLNGPALMDRLRERDTGSAVRIAFITGDAISDEAQEMLSRCDAPVLSKPFELAEIRRVVAELGGAGLA